MKKPTRKPEVAVRRLLKPSELAKVRGGGEDVAPKTGTTGTGLVALDDWEAPVV